MNRQWNVAACCAAVVWTACAEPTGVAPESGAALRAGHRTEAITALTRNLYVGADLDAVIAALASPAPDDDVPALVAAVETLGATAYPVRAGALAAEIARVRPHAVGLQEVSQIDLDLRALGIPVVTHLDFLEVLAESLAVRGQHYVVAATVRNIVAEPLPAIRLVDFDVLLVDADRVSVETGSGHTFAANIGVVAPGVEIKRGWVQAAVRIGGQAYHFASAHLESGDGPGLAGLRAAQATELAAALPTGGPVILMGDLNDVPDSPMYQVLRGAGFVDAWLALRHRAPGYTCCHQADLSNRVSQLNRRIDYVWARGTGPGFAGQVWREGALPWSRVPGPAHALWPSDHAGVALTLFVR